VNWRASARRGELWINEHHAERNADVVLCSTPSPRRAGATGARSTRARAPPARSRRATCSRRTASGFVTFGGILNWLLPTTGAVQLYRIVDAMLDTQIVLSYAWRDIRTVPRGRCRRRRSCSR
jgi:uncharacterized protein (DUF58 family)